MYQPKIQSEEMDALFSAVLSLKSPEECYRFFQDLCSINELTSFAQRFQVAALLSKGQTYHEIERLTGCSTATISRINRSLVYGENGYKLALERAEVKEEK